MPWIIVTVLIVALAAGGGWLWYSKAAAAEAAEQAENSPTAARKPAIYFALEPSFVVNLIDADSVRYLQADVQLATRDPETLKALEEQAPAIRNRLLLLFGQQTSDALIQRSGKERLQDKALAEVKGVLKREGAPDKVEAVIFTSLVTQ
jgi:flagellar FliL protein